MWEIAMISTQSIPQAGHNISRKQTKRREGLIIRPLFHDIDQMGKSTKAQPQIVGILLVIYRWNNVGTINLGWFISQKFM